MKFRLLGCLIFLVLVACDSKKTVITGQRVPVVNYEITVKVDEDAKDVVVSLPITELGTAWPQEAGNAAHLMPHGSLKDVPQQVWEVSVGYGNGAGRLLSTPIVAEGIIYTLDTRGTVIASDATSGATLWGASIAPEGHNESIIGGGLAFGDGKVFVTSPYAEALALEAKTGKVLWRYPLQSPVRAAPTYEEGRVFVLSISNQLDVVDADKGTRLWEHAGIMETAGLLGSASPAVSQGVVVVTYSSGEIFALRADNGRQLWTETLSTTRRPDSLSAISHIRALPVIDGNKVIIIGHNQRMAAYELANGERIWERSVGGTRTPAVLGDYIFMINSYNELVCLTKDYGQVVWVQKLDCDPENNTKVVWQGPLVAGDKLYVVSSSGVLATHEPSTGRLQSRRTVGSYVSLSPILSQETLYMMTDNGNLMAFR